MGAAVVKYNDLDRDNMKELGSGAFSKVYKAYRKAGSGVFALKKIELKDQTCTLMAGEEAKNIEMVGDHNNIVKYYCNALDLGCFYMVLEFCDEGNLNDYCLATPSPRRDTIFRFCREVAAGLHYMHGLDVPHGDLKPDNILIHKGTCKISDLGFSSTIENTIGSRDYYLKASAQHVFTNLMPPFWPPEVLRRMRDSNNEVRPSPQDVMKGDIFSLALVFLVLYTKQTDDRKQVLAPTVKDRTVYGDSDQAEINTAVREQSRAVDVMPEMVTNLFVTCLYNMLRVMPAERIKSDEVCKQLMAMNKGCAIL